MTRNIKNNFEINAASPEKRWFFFYPIKYLKSSLSAIWRLRGGGARMENWGNVLHPEKVERIPLPHRNKRMAQIRIRKNF